jgi:hypothetical protein
VPVVDGKRSFVTLLVALIVACGGATPASNSGAGSSAAATPGGATSGSGAPSGSGSGSGAPAASGPSLGDLLTAGKNTPYKVTYKYTFSGSGQSLTGEQSWYFKPPKSRYDFSTNVGGQSSVISFFTLPDGTYYCFAAGTTKQCLSLKSTAGSPLDQNPAATLQQAMIANPSAYGGTFTGSRTIAGQQGNCYDVSGTGAAAGAFTSGKWCFTKEGIILLSSFTAQGSSVALEATNVSTTVPDSDFELPAKPVSVP